jgi:hypothetical protein
LLSTVRRLFRILPEQVNPYRFGENLAVLTERLPISAVTVASNDVE